MFVVNYLKSFFVNPEQRELEAGAALTNLKNEFGINHNIWEGSLVVLNYDQIDSSKYKDSEIVKECRSLVLSYPDFNIVSRSFDRFFNLGETEQTIDINNCVAYEKLDGSLVNLFWSEAHGQWLYRTRSMIMPTEKIFGFFAEQHKVTWASLIAPNVQLTDDLDKECTYIFELVSIYNKVVVDYSKRINTESELFFLGCRNNFTGQYKKVTKMFIEEHLWYVPREYWFTTLENCVEYAKTLPNLEEGFVVYCKNTHKPLAKVKNPTYLVAHRFRTGAVTEDSILDLIIDGEYEEFVLYFPEYKSYVEEYNEAYKWLLESCEDCEAVVKVNDHMSQKDFALAVKDWPIASIAFMIRKGMTWKEALNKLTKPALKRLIMHSVNKDKVESLWRNVNVL